MIGEARWPILQAFPYHAQRPSLRAQMPVKGVTSLAGNLGTAARPGVRSRPEGASPFL